MLQEVARELYLQPAGNDTAPYRPISVLEGVKFVRTD